MRRYRIVEFDDGLYGVQLGGFFFWANTFLDINDPQRSAWPLEYVDTYCKGSLAQAKEAARRRLPKFKPHIGG